MSLISRLFSVVILVAVTSCGGGGGGGSGSGGNVVNANLANLNISVGSLTPQFNSGTLAYAVTVPFSDDMITITATPATRNATVTINAAAVDANDSGTFALVVGANQFEISITSGGTNKRYTINVTRLTASAFAQQSYQKASNASSLDLFGADVAISGTTLVVGAVLEDSDGTGQGDNSAMDSGAVYVFVRNGNNWVQQAYLKSSNVDADDAFGSSISISGDTIVIGASQEDGNGTNQSDNSLINSGAVYVFTRSAGVWTQQAYLKASNLDANDAFGTSVAIDGDSIIVGAASESGDGSIETDNSMVDAGAAYIFTRSGSTWSQQAYLKASNADIGDSFGTTVAFDTDTVVIGAIAEDSDGTGESDNSVNNAGAAYVFTRTGSSWSQQAYLKASSTGIDDVFATSVDIDADVVVIGAVGESSDGSIDTNNSAVSAGAAYVFTRTGSAWTQQGYLKATNLDAGDKFGSSVGVDNGVVVVGAADESGDGSAASDNSSASAGAAYVYTETGGVWSQQNYVKAFNAEAGDNFAGRLAVDGGILVLGAVNEDSNGSNSIDNSAESAGAIYINQ